MKIYENEHFTIYEAYVDAEQYLVCPKDDTPDFWLSKEDTKKLIKEGKKNEKE